MSQNPTNKAALPAKQTADNGGEFAALLQPEHRADLVADPTGGATTDAEARTAIGAVIDALVEVGIMKSS